MIVNNSTNIDKTNNHLSSQIFEDKKENDQHMTLEIQVLEWDRPKNMNSLFSN